jgi:hypothetical protein
MLQSCDLHGGAVPYDENLQVERLCRINLTWASVSALSAGTPTTSLVKDR